MDTRKKNHIISEAAQSISNMASGTTITHIAMENIIKETRENKHSYYGMVRSLKNALMQDYGIFLETMPKLGYAIAKPGDEVHLCMGDFISGVKRMGKAVRKAQYIRVDRIEDAQKRSETIQTSQKMANMLGLLKLGAPKNYDMKQMIPEEAMV